ncbi:hypothetical protein [Belnapia rosea]|uniref:Uncharacterized protein n=1 Tax=Belnapia rosea TaxID=938405 RepID=A0A1G7BSE0_9PROT|nr:hypothetical protein [Belnapia rosea]SDE30028.1 hypothetical protein SAMN04487779_10278 [Belnapia rosea]
MEAIAVDCGSAIRLPTTDGRPRSEWATSLFDGLLAAGYPAAFGRPPPEPLQLERFREHWTVLNDIRADAGEPPYTTHCFGTVILKPLSNHGWLYVRLMMLSFRGRDHLAWQLEWDTMEPPTPTLWFANWQTVEMFARVMLWPMGSEKVEERGIIPEPTPTRAATAELRDF